MAYAFFFSLYLRRFYASDLATGFVPDASDQFNSNPASCIEGSTRREPSPFVGRVRAS